MFGQKPLDYLSQDELGALWKLINISSGPCAQGIAVADFLIAWRESDFWGEINLAGLRRMDRPTASLVGTVFGFIARTGMHPRDLHSIFDENISRIYQRRSAERVLTG